MPYAHSDKSETTPVLMHAPAPDVKTREKLEGGKRFGGQWVPFAVHDQRLPERRPQYGLTRVDFRSLAIGRSRSAIFALFETQEAQFLPGGAIIGRFGNTFFEPVERRPQFGVVC